MNERFDSIWVRQGLQSVAEVERFLVRHAAMPVTFFENLREVAVAGNSMASKIETGKRTLVIDRRSGSLLDTFENHDPGSVCPSFPKLVPSTGCVFNCSYCFLQGTYRACRPFVCAYVIDIRALEKSLLRLYASCPGTTVINAGEMSDPLACDMLGYTPQIVQSFGRLDNLKLLLLTKSGINEIQPLRGADHNGHTIIAWSITCDAVVERYEPGNEPIASRLAAAKAAQDAGYEVRFRLDPMMMFDGWQEAFERTVDQVYQSGIRPSRVTLGSFRLLAGLRGIIKARFPQSDILDQPLVNDGGKRQRYPQQIREELYFHVLNCIRKHDTSVPVALCKETPEMHRVFDGLVDATKCNCLP